MAPKKSKAKGKKKEEDFDDIVGEFQIIADKEAEEMDKQAKKDAKKAEKKELKKEGKRLERMQNDPAFAKKMAEKARKNLHAPDDSGPEMNSEMEELIDQLDTKFQNLLFFNFTKSRINQINN